MLRENHGPVDRAPQPPWWGDVLRAAVYAGFWVAAHVIFRIRPRGLENLHNTPGTIFVGPHKRDSDGMIGIPGAFWKCGGRGALRRSAVVSGEHVFQPGFLAGYVVRRPQWLRRLLYPLNLTRVMEAMRWYPIPQGRRRYLLSHLLDILEWRGDLPLSEVFREAPEQFLPQAPPGARIQSVLGWLYCDALYTYYDFSIFVPDIEAGLRERHGARIEACLQRFAAVLNDGGALFLAPDGTLSPDGRFGRMKSGLPQIVERTTNGAILTPATITYDFMTTGRMTVFGVFGRPLRVDGSWPVEQLEAELRRAILAPTTVTLGQLAARALQERAAGGVREVEERMLKAELQAAAQQMARDGFEVDERLLDPAAFERRWRRFLAYCERHGLAQRSNGILRFDPEQVLGKQGRPVSPWVYSANELAGLLDARREQKFDP